MAVFEFTAAPTGGSRVQPFEAGLSELRLQTVASAATTMGLPLELTAMRTPAPSDRVQVPGPLGGAPGSGTHFQISDPPLPPLAHPSTQTTGWLGPPSSCVAPMAMSVAHP